MDVVAFVKEHPVAVGAGAIIVLFLMRAGSGSNGGASSAIAASLQSQSLANDANVKLAGINAQASATRSSYVADMYKAGIQAQTALALNQNQTSVAAVLGMMNHLDTRDAHENDLKINMSKISAAQTMAAQTLDTQLRINQNDNSTKLNAMLAALGVKSDQQTQQFILGSKTLDLQKYGIDTSYTLQNKTLDLTSSNLPLMLQHTENLQRISADNAQSLASTTQQTTLALAALNAISRPSPQAPSSGSGKSSGGGFDWADAAKIAAEFFI